MHDSVNEPPLEIIKWGTRLLYLELFVFMIVSMFYWDYPPTLPYLGAILCLFYVNRIWEQHGKEEIEMVEDDVHKCTLEFEYVHWGT